MRKASFAWRFYLEQTNVPMPSPLSEHAEGPALWFEVMQSLIPEPGALLLWMREATGNMGAPQPDLESQRVCVGAVGVVSLGSRRPP